MKTTIKLLTITYIIAFLFTVSITGCKDKVIEEWTVNTPVYMSYEDFRASVTTAPMAYLENPGKIYFMNNYIFINELSQGVHIYDNSDPSNPQYIVFIEIPGNVDIAVKNSTLYADSYVDLVVLNISDLDNIVEVNRLEDVFPYTIPFCDNEYPVSDIDESQGVVVDWETGTLTTETGPSGYPWYPWYGGGFIEDGMINTAYSGGNGGGGTAIFNNSYGVGGSMARFIVYQNMLYTIDNSTLHLFDITSNTNPSQQDDFSVQWGIETVFIYNDNLFIGSQSGMVIYDLSNPMDPQYVSTFAHATGCDPVVVEEDYAYITLRSGNSCGGFSDQLDVVDISDLAFPDLVKTYVMTGPSGLGIDNGTLFICDGNAGLKIYNAYDPLTIDDNMIAHYPDMKPFDVIPVNNILLTIAEDGFYQYDYSDINNIQLLSVISIN